MRKLFEGVAATAIGLAYPVQAQTSAPVSSDEGEQIGDIVVTATKRPERVRDIPASINALNERELETLGAQSYADYLTRVPGVVFNQTVPGNSAVILRGVATTTGISQAQGTTGYFINEAPLTDPFYSGGIPDIDTFDVDNITILRGPQGTLFGSSSLGGAINYQASRPDLNEVLAHVRGTFVGTRRGESGFNAGLMLNVPIVSDVLAARGVYTRRRIGGFVDNLGTGETNSNRTDIEGGRALLTFQPAAGTSLNYLFLTQTSNTQDAGSTEPAVGPFAKRTVTPETFGYRTTLHNGRLDQDVGAGTITATVSVTRKRLSGDQDYSTFVPAFLRPARFLEPGRIDGESYEARYASPVGRPIELLVGVFHNTTREQIRNTLVAPNAAAALGTTTALDALVEIRARESAIFGEASLRFASDFKLTLGGRGFRTRLDSTTTSSGPLVGATTVQLGRSRESGFNPKASLAWQPNDDVLVYALVSRGFRFGGPNLSSAADPTVPAQFGSDSLTNYELGTRLAFAERRLTVDGTLYWVDWNDIQFSQRSGSGLVFTGNAGRARNRGFEIAATAAAAPGLSLRGAATYLDGRLRTPFGSGPTLVPAGSRLPGASQWQISESVTYAPANMRFSPTIAFSHRYLSSAPGELRPNPRMQGDYHLFDLRVGASLGNLGATVFVENIGDARGVSQAVTGLRGPVEFLVRPRTIGLTLDYRL